MIGVLLRQRLRLFWNHLAHRPRKVRRLAGAALAVAFTVGFVMFAGLNAGAFVERIARIDPATATYLVPLLLLAMTVLTLVTSMGSAVHHLFLAGDLELLLAAPITERTLFWLKAIEVWRDSVHVLLFQAAALFGYGQALHLPGVFYPLALLVAVAFTLAASALGVILTLALARVRFGESILGASRIVAVALFLPIGVLGVPAIGFGRGRLSAVVGQDNVQAAAATLRELGPPPDWAPTAWAAHVLLGDPAAGLSIVGLGVLGLGLVLFTQLAFGRLFQAGWERVRFGGPRRRGTVARGGRGRASAGPLRGLLLKDWRTLARDPRWRTGALVSLVALGLPVLLLFAGDPFARTAHAVQFWFAMLPVPYLAYLFGSQQGAATLAYEGRNIALLRAAPVGMGRIMVAKFLGGLVVVLGVTWLATLALAVSHGGEPHEIVAALAAATWLALGATLAAVAGAALTADFEGDNPQRRVGLFGAILTSTLSLFFFVTNTGLMVWWVARTALSVPRPLLDVLPIVDVTLPVLAGLSVVTILLASRMGRDRLAGWEAS